MKALSNLESPQMMHGVHREGWARAELEGSTRSSPSWFVAGQQSFRLCHHFRDSVAWVLL